MPNSFASQVIRDERPLPQQPIFFFFLLFLHQWVPSFIKPTSRHKKKRISPISKLGIIIYWLTIVTGLQFA